MSSQQQSGDLEKGRAVTVHLPWPYRDLSPNARKRWGKIKATKMYRFEASLAAWAAMGHERFTLRPPVQATVTFLMPDRRRRDGDNLRASLKPAWDGFVQAKLLEDDSMDKLKITDGEHRYEKPGGVVIELREKLND